MNSFRHIAFAAAGLLAIASSSRASPPTNIHSGNDSSTNSVATSSALSSAIGTGLGIGYGGSGGDASVDSRISNLTSNNVLVSSNPIAAANGGDANASVGDIYSPSSASAR